MTQPKDIADTDLRAELARAAEPPPPLAPEHVDAMFAAVALQTVDRRPGWRGRLRELPTGTRILLAVGGALLMTVVALAVVGTRGDLTGQAVIRYGVCMTAIAALVGAAFAVSLRGAHQAPMGRGVWVVIVIALGLPIVLSLMPWLWATPAGAMPASQEVAVPCLALGLITGTLTAIVAWIFQRDDWGVAWRLTAAMAGGGLTAFAMLQLHCPSSDATHLLVAHAGVGLALTVVVAVGIFLRRRPQPV